jgi:hypothetical protein
MTTSSEICQKLDQLRYCRHTVARLLKEARYREAYVYKPNRKNGLQRIEERKALEFFVQSLDKNERRLEKLLLTTFAEV